jgi:hypothetical protein
LLALVDDDLLVDAGVLVGPAELGQPVGLLAQLESEPVLLAGLVLDDDDWSPETSTTTPSPSARSTSPASRAARASTPVPM